MEGGNEALVELESIANQNNCTKCLHQCNKSAERQKVGCPINPLPATADGYWKEQER